MRFIKTLRKFIDSNDDRNAEFESVLNMFSHIITPSFNEINVLHAIHIRNGQARGHLAISKFDHKGGRTLGPPPCIFNARTVATKTTQSGTKELALHLILNAFSIPQSAPNPASVMTYPARSLRVSSASVPANFKAILSAIMDELP